jgi:hypothetical protein
VRGIELGHAQRKCSSGTLFDTHRDLPAECDRAYSSLDGTVPLHPSRQVSENAPDLVDRCLYVDACSKGSRHGARLWLDRAYAVVAGVVLQFYQPEQL